ncbi:hypothetical protein AVEN_250903-1 [Araneus ventricosus]|uniref:Peptidase aspartic putative domain-containing protein n=1 Tax=Araneus ventricosus TaxID=182803 RepID=A0A4Y2S3E5_ARAVE|nr:hypothetical protein AVEN_250903-1 [Araneus ventricosus]
MEAFKLKLKILSTTFTYTAKAIDQEITKSQVDVNKLRELSSQLTEKFQSLETTQDSISELLLNENQENEYSKDFNEAEIYRERYLSLRSKIENFEIESNSESQSVKSCDRKYRLPKLKLKKFNGDIKSFLGFCSQFSRIHEDEEMSSEDKFQYLIQAITPGTRAASLIESFPPTAQNYPKAIELLKERFGREDLLVQVYVKELLKMSHLRALDTLDRSKEKFADLLSPLVESCPPEEVLRAWERHRTSSILNNDAELPENSQKSLKNLKDFLRQEVNGEEMINLERSGFGCQEFHLPLLISHHIFYHRDHAYLPYVWRRLAKNGSCAIKPHTTNQPTSPKTIYLKTLVVRLKNGGRSQYVRALLDDGSHRSYIEKDLARELRLLPSGKETLSQGLFGGNQTPEAEHYRYTINVERIDGKFSCQMSVLDQSKICTTLPRVRDKHLLAELENHERKSTKLLENETLAYFQETVKKIDNRYEVALPWLAGHPTVYDMYDVAESRLRSVTKRLLKENIFEAYDDVLRQWQRDDIIETIPEDEISNPGHYLPHRPVIKPSSATTKVRPVFDASFKRPGYASLNECLSVGPSLSEQIPPLLLRFRTGAIGVIADIKQAFLQLSVRPEDRDFLRLL